MKKFLLTTTTLLSFSLLSSFGIEINISDLEQFSEGESVTNQYTWNTIRGSYNSSGYDPEFVRVDVTLVYSPSDRIEDIQYGYYHEMGSPEYSFRIPTADIVSAVGATAWPDMTGTQRRDGIIAILTPIILEHQGIE